MKILTLSWEYPPRVVGGLARHVEELSRAQIRAWEQIHVITADHPYTPAYEQMAGVHVHRVKNDFIDISDFLESIKHLNVGLFELGQEILKERGFDLIHAHDWLVADSAVALKQTFNLPLIVTMHATERGRWGGIYNDIQRYINYKEWQINYESARTIVCSDFMKGQLENHFNLPSDKIRVIPNGVELDKFDVMFDGLDFRRHFAFDHEKIIMTVGRMVPEKGLHHLIDAIPRVLYNFPNAKFVLVGGGPQKESLINHVRDLGLRNKVYFPGKIDDLSLIKLLKVSDVAVYPSLYEPFGIVVLEAMACHLPVVVSDAGGLKEIVLHEKTGLTSYAGNPNSIAWGLLEMLRNPGKAAWFADRAYKRLLREFNWDIITEQTKNIYREVI